MMIDLDASKKNNPFFVPDNYFETLQTEAMKAVRHEQILRIKRKKIKRLVASAAAVLLLIVGSVFFITFQNNDINTLVVVPDVQSTETISQMPPSAPISTSEMLNNESMPARKLQKATPSPSSTQQISANIASNDSQYVTLSKQSDSKFSPKSIETITYTLASSYEEDLSEELFCELVEIYDYCYDY